MFKANFKGIKFTLMHASTQQIYYSNSINYMGVDVCTYVSIKKGKFFYLRKFC